MGEPVRFAVLGALMLVSKLAMEWAPNIHPLALFIAAFTLVYRGRALIPLYIFVLLDGIVAGFHIWWLPNLYIWLPLWGAFMLLGRFDIKKKVAIPLYMLVCAFHGMSFGTLHAPTEALLWGLSFKATLAWIAYGLPYDAIHAAGDFAAAALILPLVALLKKLERGTV